MSIFEQENIAVYGFGSFGRSIARLMIEKNLHVKYVIDQDIKYSGFKYDIGELSINVRSIDEADLEDTIIIGIHNTKTDIKEVYNILVNRGFKKIMTPVQLMQDFKEQSINFENYWLDSNFDLSNQSENINDLKEKLYDADSKRLLDKIVSYRTQGTIDDSPIPDPVEQQYFPVEIEKYARNNLRILDCGAFPGEIITNALKNGYLLDEVVMFEPDLKNHQEMNNLLSKESFSNIISLPFAVFSETKKIKFQENLGTSSKIDSRVEENKSVTTEILAVALDDIFLNFSPNLLKMDIEGAELEALYGSKKILEKYRPDLAISIYHKPTDIYTIFEFLRDLKLDYNFSIRTYGHQTFDTILYAY